MIKRMQTWWRARQTSKAMGAIPAHAREVASYHATLIGAAPPAPSGLAKAVGDAAAQVEVHGCTCWRAYEAPEGFCGWCGTGPRPEWLTLAEYADGLADRLLALPNPHAPYQATLDTADAILLASACGAGLESSILPECTRETLARLGAEYADNAESCVRVA